MLLAQLAAQSLGLREEVISQYKAVVCSIWLALSVLTQLYMYAVNFGSTVTMMSDWSKDSMAQTSW